MPRPDEGMIHAWLDGELSADEAATVERLVAEDAAWAAAAAEARGLIAASSRILGALDVVAGDVIPGGGTAAPTVARPVAPTVAPTVSRATPRRVPGWMRLAAGFVLVAGVAYLGRDTLSPTQSAVMSEPMMTAAEATVDAGARVGAADVGAEPTATVQSEAPASAPVASSAVASLPVAQAREEQSPPVAKAREELSSAVDGKSATARQDGPPAPPAPTATLDNADARERTRTLLRDSASQMLSDVVVTGVSAASAASAANEAERTRSEARKLLPSSRAAAMVAAGSGVASDARAAASVLLEGCWSVRTTAAGESGTLAVDSIQRSLRGVPAGGDSLQISLSPNGVIAIVRRDSVGVLVGRLRDLPPRIAALHARAVDCPR